jgi:2-C-methyl-D-erythritol 4-phosphate cytidylyltransferase
MSQFAVIFPAAGRSTRFGDPKRKKIYAELEGRAVWLRAVLPFVNRGDVGQLILAISEEDRELFEQRFRPNLAFLNIQVIHGGAERYDTVARALEVVEESCDFVAVHDAARPCVTTALIDAVFAAAREHGAALPGVAVSDTLKRVDDGKRIVETVSRASLYAVQTPQAFRKSILIEAYARRSALEASITDDAQLVEAAGHPCYIVDGSPHNLKITTAPDLAIASAILKASEQSEERPKGTAFFDERAMW